MSEIKNNEIPLCVDLDGTLVATDTLFESIIGAIKLKPWILFILPFWCLLGKIYLKNKIGDIYKPDSSTLPFRDDVIEYLNSEKLQGRKIILATASIQAIADDIAVYTGLFDEALGSSRTFNLLSGNKEKILKERFGFRGYDYIGDSKKDIKVWKSARGAGIVGNQSKFFSKIDEDCIIFKTFEEKSNKFKLFFNEIRIHQWVKNLLLLFPLLMAHLLSANLFLMVLLSFISFSLCASKVYLLNDLFDLESDRHHPTKKNRPLASGALSIKFAFLLIPLFFIISFGISLLWLPLDFTIALAIYFVLTTSYSLKLKSFYIIDIILLASLYTLRLIAGAVAVNVYISPWLLEFSMFLFLSLAVIKRYTELRIMIEQNKTESKGRGYSVEDMSLLRAIGMASGYIAVFVFTLYINSKEVIQLYKQPELLWPVAVCLLYWITRMWFLAHRGKMHDDPIVFTVKDYVSYIVGFIIIILVIGAII